MVCDSIHNSYVIAGNLGFSVPVLFFSLAVTLCEN